MPKTVYPHTPQGLSRAASRPGRSFTAVPRPAMARTLVPACRVVGATVSFSRLRLFGPEQVQKGAKSAGEQVWEEVDQDDFLDLRFYGRGGSGWVSEVCQKSNGREIRLLRHSVVETLLSSACV